MSYRTPLIPGGLKWQLVYFCSIKSEEHPFPLEELPFPPLSAIVRLVTGEALAALKLTNRYKDTETDL